MFQALLPLLLSDVIKGINWMPLWCKSTFIKESLTERTLFFGCHNGVSTKMHASNPPKVFVYTVQCMLRFYFNV